MARMNGWRWIGAYVWYDAGRTLMTVTLFALGTALMVMVAALGGAFERGVLANVRGADMVVGAKGSPLQLVLSSVVHADVPTGNVPLHAVEELARHPLVRQVIPLALGDNAGGFRIVGTTPDYAGLYDAAVAEGRMFAAPMEAVAGSTVAAAMGWRAGATFAGAHGLSGGGDVHADHPFVLVGVLAPTGSVLDRLVLTPVDSVWMVHAGHHHHDGDENEEAGEHAHGDEHDHDAHADEHGGEEENAHDGRELTAAIVRLRSPLAMVSLTREINAGHEMQAAVPMLEMHRLRAVTGVGEQALTMLGGIMLALAAMGLLLSMAQALRTRTYDLALLRSFGASPYRLGLWLMLEGGLTGAAGGIIGLLCGAGAANFMAQTLLQGMMMNGSGMTWTGMATVVAGVTVLGVTGSLLPVWRALRVQPADVLARH